MIDWSELTLFIYITARMSGFVLFNPLLGRNNIPGIFKAGLILVLAVSVISSSGQEVAVPSGILVLSIRIILELALGMLLGMAVSFFFYIPQLAGEVMDMQMGMSMNKIYDPGSQTNMSVTGQILNVMMILLFFVANGHHTLIRILVTSGDIVPFGQAAFGEDIYYAALRIFIECTALGVKLALPILAAELVGQVGMGVLMKVIPQINVFAINIDLKILIGLTLLMLLMAPFSEFLLKVEMNLLETLGALLRMVAP